MLHKTPGGTRGATPPAQEAVPRLRLRLYRHGLGDCMLLRFAKSGGGTFNVLIDCGVISVGEAGRNATRQVAQDIAQACDNRLDVVVMTHEHWDHASGFSPLQARDIFDTIEVGEAWYGWTEDPASPLGSQLRKEREAKVRALAQASKAIAASKLPNAAERAGALDELLGFFGLGAKDGGEGIGRTRAAFSYFMRPGVRKRFCDPQQAPLRLPGVPDVRVFVLGPPQSQELIKKSAPSRRAREAYDATAEMRLSASLEAAFLRMAEGDGAPHDDSPFPPAVRVPRPGSGEDDLSVLVRELWADEQQGWRQIEEDWLQAAEDLALNLDAHTNNTSVVLAFEFADTGEVFLFPADAQVGSWLSWRGLTWRVDGPAGPVDVSGEDLLRRTVFYKVGHHGSHNATLRAAGLELMQSEDLVAFIPVIEADARKKRWGHMPFEPLLKRLREKTGQRVLRSDEEPPVAARDAHGLVAAPLYFELSFGGKPPR